MDEKREFSLSCMRKRDSKVKADPYLSLHLLLKQARC